MKKGDVEVLKEEQQKIGINIATLLDEGYKHNAIFYGCQVKDEDQAIRMIQYLIN